MRSHVLKSAREAEARQWGCLNRAQEAKGPGSQDGVFPGQTPLRLRVQLWGPSWSVQRHPWSGAHCCAQWPLNFIQPPSAPSAGLRPTRMGLGSKIGPGQGFWRVRGLLCAALQMPGALSSVTPGKEAGQREDLCKNSAWTREALH